jgi:hypothetical protein
MPSIYQEWVADINAAVCAGLESAYGLTGRQVDLSGVAEQIQKVDGEEVNIYPAILDTRGNATKVGWDVTAKTWGYHRQIQQSNVLDETSTGYSQGGPLRVEQNMLFVFSMPRRDNLHPAQVGAWLAGVVNREGATYTVVPRQVNVEPNVVNSLELSGKGQSRPVPTDAYVISVEYTVYYYTSACLAPC